MTTVFASTSREDRVYQGEATRAVAMPLGGIGTGNIALAGDGSLRQWQIHNQVNHLACVPHSFFAVWTRQYRPVGVPVARVLQSDAHYGTEGPAAPPTSNDHVVPIPHRRLLQKLPGVAATEFTGTYPVAGVRYLDDELPVDVSLEAFNPFVPLDSRDSGIPAILFAFTVRNPTEETRLVSIAGTLQNAVGWDGVAPIFDARCQLYGGNANTVVRTGDSTTISMGNAHLPDYAAGNGTMAISTSAPNATWLTQWDSLSDFWETFAATGQFGNLSDSTPSVPGRTWNGALAVPFVLEPGEERVIPFTIAWHFPNRYVNWDQGLVMRRTDSKSQFWLGNRYNTWFRSALDVVEHVESEGERLGDLTRRVRDTFYDSTLPFSVIESVVSQTSIIRSPTCFWDEAGHFYGFEGCSGESTLHHTDGYGGCCPLNCTHVWNYEMSLSRLFPDLDRDMRDTEWNVQQHSSGYLPHRVLMPSYLKRPWGQTIGGPDKPALDGLLGAILKTWREYRGSGDRAWLESVWPQVKLALDHLWLDHDPDRAGIILGEQPNTYDISIYGANTFTGTLYLAALRAVEEMATLFGESELANTCREVVARGQVELEKLWNGEYYIQEVDLDAYPEQNWGQGCHMDQLFGQWWAHYLGLGHLLEPERVRTAVTSIFDHNFREDFHGFTQGERQFAADEDAGVLICTWPHGGRPGVPTRYSDEVWTGLEYELAGLLLYEGEVERAVRLLDATRARYDGRKQNPWNDIECGDHYVRAMASWTLLEAASGFTYEAASGAIGFRPVVDPASYRAPFVARDGWGTFDQHIADDRGMVASIGLAWGHLDLRSIVLAAPDGVGAVSVSLGESSIPVALDARTGGATVRFMEPIRVEAGQVLRVSLD